MATSTTTAPKPTPSANFKNGDSVQVTARDQSAGDLKSGLYFKHYANLHGTILKLYGEEASVLVNRESLSDEIRERHETGEAAMRKKWLDGLSEEGRNRLNAREKAFSLNYAILVSLADLKPYVPAEVTVESDKDEVSGAANRLSESQLTAAEERFLAERAHATKKNGKS